MPLMASHRSMLPGPLNMRAADIPLAFEVFLSIIASNPKRLRPSKRTSVASGLCRRFERSHFNPADEHPRRHREDGHYDLRHILRLHLLVATCSSTKEFCIGAPRHYGAYCDILLPVVEHHRFAKAVESELGSAICRSSGYRISAQQTADIDDNSRLRAAGILTALPGSSRIHRSNWS